MGRSETPNDLEAAPAREGKAADLLGLPARIRALALCELGLFQRDRRYDRHDLPGQSSPRVSHGSGAGEGGLLRFHQPSESDGEMADQADGDVLQAAGSEDEKQRGELLLLWIDAGAEASERCFSFSLPCRCTPSL